MIVDEDVRTLHASFVRHGWQVTTAGRMREATMLLNQQNYDLLVCGMTLRDGGASGVLDYLRQIGSSTPVVVLVDNSSVSEIVLAVRGGAFDFHDKGRPFEDLQAIAQRALQQVAMAAAPGTVNRRAGSESAALDLTLSDLNRIHLEDALHLASGNRTRAAEMLGVSVRTVRNKIRQYGLPARSQA